jgi:Tol biopolymer transport system component
MISPSGKDFIFIHRYYYGKQRLDRLMYSDFGKLKIVLDYGMISHYCWIDGKTIIGFVQVEEKQGFFIINIESGKIEECTEINKLCLGDGHPSCYKKWIVFDTYPNKDRMQRLLLYNLKTKEIIPLLELFQSVKYLYQTRCDLHPRFSPDGKYVFFDTVYTSKRQHCSIDISKIIF